MKIVIRVATKSRHKERMIETLSFKSEVGGSVRISPIPEFVKDPSCKFCNKPATVLSGINFSCSNCLNLLIGKSKLVSKEELFSPSIKHAIFITIFEWSTNNETWYRLKGSNIVPDSTSIISDEELHRRFHNLMIEVITGNPQEVEADYEKTEKKLKVFV
jgi:hypothetical protein